MTVMALCGLSSSFAQTAAPAAKKPIIMVVPSTIWCVDNGFYTEIENEDGTVKVPDYKRALAESRDINLVVTQMGKIMADRGFPLVDLQAAMNSIESDEMELSLITGASTGSAIAETPLEKFNRTAKADIVINVDFETTKSGPKSRTTFNVRALDSYTDKQISGVQGGVSSTSAPIDSQLNTSVLNLMDSFTAQLQLHFDDLFANGREIQVRMFVFESSPINFESEFDYNGQYAELADIIGVWFEENAIQARFSETARSANVLTMSQVRMPLMGKSLSGREVPIDARAFVRPLASMLQRAPYDTTVKIHTKGLGEVWLILGEK